MRTFEVKIVADQWLSSILEREVCKVSVIGSHWDSGSSSMNSGDSLKAAMRKKPLFLYAKVPVNALDAVGFLEKAGFCLADTSIVFEKATKVQRINMEHKEVRFAEPEDKDKVVEIARSSFRFSRFHMDVNIDKSLADTIKAEWAGNYFVGKRGDYMVVVQDEGKVAGFTQLFDQGKALLIDLIAIAENHRGKGLARKIIEFIQSSFPKCGCIRVGTQVVNIPSIRLYESVGFRVAESGYVFHYHNI